MKIPRAFLRRTGFVKARTKIPNTTPIKVGKANLYKIEKSMLFHSLFIRKTLEKI